MVSLVLLGACVTADVGLIYGTRTYNTKRVAEKIAKASGLVAIPVEKLTLEAFSAFDHLIVGAPTLNTGNVVRRSGTPMDEFLYTVLPAAGSLHGKKVALFGLGEQMPYPSSFCEALDELGTCFRDSGAQLIGRWPLDGYDIWESRAVWNGEFVGLTIDEEDQPELTDERIERWLKQLKAEGMPLCLQNEARRHLVELASENDWYELWAHRVDCWWSALPAASQSTLRSCAGALGLHLSARLDAALGRTPKPTIAQPGCEWIRQGAPQLEMLPEMPPADGIHFRLPPLPRMLPGWLQLEAQAREGGARTEPMERAAAPSAERHAPKSSFYATFGIGAASGAMGALALSAAIWWSGGRRRS